MALDAKQMDFLISGFGQIASQWQVRFWTDDNATTPKDVYGDANKGSVLSQPVILDQYGAAEVFGDGIYFIEVFDKNGVKLFDHDLISYETTLVDFGGLYIDVGETFGDSASDIQDAIDSVDPAEKAILLFKDDVFSVSQDITVPDNIVVWVHPTATIDIASGFSFTQNRQMIDTGCRVFTGAGTPVFNNFEYVRGVWLTGTQASGQTIYGNSDFQNQATFQSTDDIIIGAKTLTEILEENMIDQNGLDLLFYVFRDSAGQGPVLLIDDSFIKEERDVFLKFDSSFLFVKDAGQNYVACTITINGVPDTFTCGRENNEVLGFDWQVPVRQYDIRDLPNGPIDVSVSFNGNVQGHYSVRRNAF